MSVLDASIALACRVHAGQVDKSGKAYILHPLRLMMQFKDIDAQLTALLHDVIEDGDVSLGDLRALGVPEAVVAAVDCMTKRPGDTYETYIGRIAEVSLARRVKICDLKDNMDMSRLETLQEADLQRLAKYHRALQKLLEQECAGS